MWADGLKLEEVQGTLRAADRLGGVGWAVPLLERVKPFLDRVRVGLTDKDAYRANPVTPAETSFLFEVRFAAALCTAGVAAAYEYGAGVGNSTVDFRVDVDPRWLVELVSLRESEALKAAYQTDGLFQGYVLRTDGSDPKQSLEGEALKAQERIGAKAFDRKRGPIKFPTPAGWMHMIMVDARGFAGDGRGDEIDWYQIVHGANGLNPSTVLHWTDPATGIRAPIRGLFEPECKLAAAPILQARVHVIGFVCERTFRDGEIDARAVYRCNPFLIGDEAAALAMMSRWPLHLRQYGRPRQ